MKRKFNEWLSIQLAKRPTRMVLLVILLFNVLFFLFSAVVISNLSLSGTEKMSFFEAAFCTITMILDAGCIQFVVADIGKSGVAIVVTCLVIIFVGMISFTGAVIGYITNYISNFIEQANTGTNKLRISGHTVILNWNTRASEIVNDLLYCTERQKVVVLVASRRKEIEKEIEERMSDTVARENQALKNQYADLPFLQREIKLLRNRFKKNITVIVREGDVFSSMQLRDIALEKARAVVILGNDINNTICKFEHRELLDNRGKGNSQTIKTLMQVADITAAESSADDQKIIVEINDNWTQEIVEKIIKAKQVDGKCNIVPINVNHVLGQILSQFSLMPELNLAYKELFSNKGAAFYTREHEKMDDVEYIRKYLKTHRHALPLTFMDDRNESFCYYSAGAEKDITKRSEVSESDYAVKLKNDYWIEHKNIIILGHNSKCEDIMNGFLSFRGEWSIRDDDNNIVDEILRVMVIDEEENLKKIDYYKQYRPFVIETCSADIYDKDKICEAIERFVSSYEEDTSILILSDDSALNEDIDANALTNLVYVQEIINNKKAENEAFDPESMDVIVEIIDPKHHDIVNSYSVNNVVISNRYISKMITQIGEKEAIFDFYKDILTYDLDSEEGFKSKEIYVKKVSRFFTEIPEPCTAQEFVRAVFEASVDESLPKDKINPTIVLGYVKPGGKMVLFSGDQSEILVELDKKDKLIVFSNH